MPCYHPIKAFPIGVTNAGKTAYKLAPYTADHVEFIKGSWQAVSTSLRSSLAKRVSRDFIEIPCGKCVGCRLDYSREWANRCVLELEDSSSAWFVTLTYDDQHLPRSAYADPETGEALASYSLRKTDFQLFMKRLRYYFPDNKIRFFAAGEYGSNTHRPHYHAILYNAAFDDLEFYKKSLNGDIYWNSKKLDAAWNKGFAVIGEVTWQSCAYVARYCMKKADGVDASYYEHFNIEPEFTLMSRKPGIGRMYLDKHPDLYQYQKIFVSTPQGGKEITIPKYFDRVVSQENPEMIEALKEKRKAAAIAKNEAIMKKTDLGYLDYLKVAEDNKKARIKSLRRNL